jgi:hypothetical protein
MSEVIYCFALIELVDPTNRGRESSGGIRGKGSRTCLRELERNPATKKNSFPIFNARCFVRNEFRGALRSCRERGSSDKNEAALVDLQRLQSR